MSENQLEKRCKEFLGTLKMNGILRQGDPVRDLMAFVEAERGRSASPYLDKTKPLILYFGNEEDREEFMAIVREVKPNMMTKKLP